MERFLRRWKGTSGARVFGVSLTALLLLGSPSNASGEEEGEGGRVELSPLTRGARAVGYKHKEGEYGGVTPGVIYPYADEDQKRRFKRPPPRRKNVLSWVGFQPRPGGGARVFAQLGREAEYEQEIDGNVLRVRILGVHTRRRNTLRRIDTHFFDTAIKEIDAKRVHRRGARKGRPAHRAGVEITIQFKNPADAGQAQASLTREEDGYYYLYLDFGPGTDLPDEPKPTGGEAPGDAASTPYE